MILERTKIIEIMERFKAQNPSPKSELDYKNAYTLLVSTVLSAQATDKSVNICTKPLYETADTPQKMLELGQEKLCGYIKRIGLWQNKSKNIIALSQKLIDDFNGEVPSTMEELITLPGVGRKTANVVLNVIFGKPSMPVDTHLFRIAPKIGLAEGKNPLEVEKSLLENIPEQYLKNAHHWLLLHGRYTCTARNPKCSTCLINDTCLFSILK